MLLPLAVVISVTACKDLYEDLKRHESDREENFKQVMRFDRTKKMWIQTVWQDLQVGDIVRIFENQFFPADMVLLASSGK